MSASAVAAFNSPLFLNSPAATAGVMPVAPARMSRRFETPGRRSGS